MSQAFFKLKISYFTIITLLCFTAFYSLNIAAESGTKQDNDYAAKLWKVMEENKLIGKDRVRSYPFVGKRPHGSIQEMVVTEATVDGHKGRLIVKHNYGADNDISPHSVYSANAGENYVALTIMFKREKGYDSANNDWFWAEYYADGGIIKHKGKDLTGRAPLCISCHAALGGEDREILNGR